MIKQEDYNKQQFYLISLSDNYNKILEECRFKNEEIINLKKTITDKKEVIIKLKKNLKAQVQINESNNKNNSDNYEMKKYYEKKIQDLTNSVKALKKSENKLGIHNSQNDDNIKIAKNESDNKADNLLIMMKNKLQEVSFENEKNLLLNKVLKDQILDLEQELINFRSKSIH